LEFSPGLPQPGFRIPGKDYSSAGVTWHTIKVHGSLVQTEREQAGLRKPFRYLSRSVQGRNRITYVSEHQVRRVQEAFEAGRAARDLLERASDLTMAIIKAESKA